jgi:hypothetical protein
MTASDENEILTADDIAGLNRQAVLRAAAFTRLAGAALVVAGVLAIIAWGWILVRDQLRLDDYDDLMLNPAPAESPVDSRPLIDFAGAFDITFADRVDVLLGRLGFSLTAVVAVGVGLGLRLFADYSVARTGGSLTGFEPGDRA